LGLRPEIYGSLLFLFLLMAAPFCCTCCISNLYHPSYIILYIFFYMLTSNSV
jgi:hypothetical protein